MKSLTAEEARSIAEDSKVEISEVRDDSIDSILTYVERCAESGKLSARWDIMRRFGSVTEFIDRVNKIKVHLKSLGYRVHGGHTKPIRISW
jgi:hypothetical protein